ncbi:PAS domain-containing protein [Synechococcus sp. C9]|uniref:PAS domain-containing sensor histidine kinase n=1 Tax=Synechococcus sp. C9 TaxID=102119 RepID=UPI001FF65B35|nr:PAS domain-containing protein [Synechococcus sp. C9]
MTRRLQAGDVVADVLQDTLGQLQQGWGVQHLALYRNEQLVLSSGETFHPGQLPDTWQVEKRANTNGETWFCPVMVHQQKWGWLVAHWLVPPAESITAQGKLFTAHLGLVIAATGWEYAATVKPGFHQTTLADEPYHFLLDVLPIGVALRNPAGDFIYVNEYLVEQLLQMPPHELLGRGWITVLHPEDRGRVIQSWLRRTQPPLYQKEEYRLKRQNGSVIYLREQSVALNNPDGMTVGFIAIFTDITEEKTLQSLLTKNEQKYRQIVEYQTDFLAYSLPDQTITFANRCLYEALGYSLESAELVGMKWEQVVLNPEDLQILEQHIRQLTPKNPIFSYINPVRGKQGQILEVEWLNLGIFDDAGHLLSIQSIGRDITLLRQTERELRESQERFSTLLGNIPGMVYRYHPATPEHPDAFSYLSSGAEDIFEFTVEEIKANPRETWMRCTHPEDLDLLLSSIQTAVANQGSWFCEWRIITPSGKLKWLQGRSQMRQQSEGEPYWDGILLDITEKKNTELQLAQQAEFLHRILVATQAIIYVYDLVEQRNVFVNNEIEFLLGYSVTEIQAMGNQLLPNIIHPEDLPKVQALHENLAGIRDKEGFEVTYRVRTKSGEWRWMLSQDRVLSRDKQGLPKQVLGVATDITELKNTELALAEKQQLLDNVLSNLPVAVLRYQLCPDGREALLYVSAGCEKVYGVTAEEAIQNIPKLWGLVVPEDLLSLKQLTQQSAQNLSIIETEFRIRTPQGQLKWLRIYGQPERQADGSTIWDSVFLDITSKKEAQLALQKLNQELEQRIHDRTLILQKQAQKEGSLRLIIETIHQAVSIEQMLKVVLDSARQNLGCDRVVLYKFNPDWSGYFVAESVAPGWVSVVTEPLSTLSDHCLEETQGGRFQQHYILVSNDIYQSGFTPCHIEVLEKFQARAFVITPVFLENKLWGLLAAYQNSGSRIWQMDEIDFLQHIGLHLAIALRQSELYQAAQAQVVELQKLNKLKDEFLSTVSHELRSPMHNIKMGLKMLELKLQKSGILADTELGISRYLDILKSSTERETNLINDLLDLARLNADELTLELTQVDVREVLDKILPPIEERTQTQNQGFTVQLPTEFCPLYTHQHSLERILQELLHNACKYTPAGETITLAIERESERFCCFRVINTGVDIPPAEQERVFDNFYRIPTHDPWQYGGTGLGLALVKKLVERLGGTIRLTSENKRTEFAVRLPISCPREGEMATTHQLSDDSLAS